jgi:hypothetical protein
MLGVWATIDADLSDEGVTSDPGQRPPDALDGLVTTADEEQKAGSERLPEIPGPAREWIRSASLVAMSRYCDRAGKRLYVDKSLDSVHHLGLVRQLFPDVRCLLAFRHVMDTIASGIEASPWGFQAYGYGPYVQTSPGNTVAALARYWLDHVSEALAWEQQLPETCLRVRYEDLVANPEASVKAVQQFLGVREDLSVLRRAFDREPARGPGDYKVVHTSAVHAGSVGHGKRVPVGMLPPPLLTAINEKLEILGYPPLDRSWNAAERPIGVATDNIWSQRLHDVMATARNPTEVLDLGPFALVAEDHLALRWVIDPESETITQGDGDVEAVLTGTTEDLYLMLTDQENLGVLIRSGRIRYVVADEDGASPRDRTRELESVVATLRSCVSGFAGQSLAP